jgi:hypothetical protein
MCGDLDEEPGFETALYARFRNHAQSLLAKASKSAATAPVHASLDKLFNDALSRSIRDQEGMEERAQYELMSMQPLVFARLAGFIAAHSSLQDDPLRKLIEALMLGYADAERLEPYHGHDHDYDHEHGHHHEHHH